MGQGRTFGKITPYTETAQFDRRIDTWEGHGEGEVGCSGKGILKKICLCPDRFAYQVYGNALS